MADEFAADDALRGDPRTHVERAIWAVAGSHPPTTENFWRWVATELLQAPVVGLSSPPPDWDGIGCGRFEGRVLADPRDPHRGARVEYLARGSAEARVARIVHETAELLLLRLEAGEPGAGGAASDEPRQRRHELAVAVERAVLARIFPPRRDPRAFHLALAACFSADMRRLGHRHELATCRVDGVEYDDG